MKQVFDKKIIQEIYWKHSYKIHNNAVLVNELTAEELLDFTDKQSYLEWVKHWKDFYKALAAEQKQLRIDLSKPHNVYIKTEWGEYLEASVKMELRQTNKFYLRILLEARRIAKRRSWQMKQDALTKV